MSVSKIKPSLKSIVRTEFQTEKRNDKPGSWLQTLFLALYTVSELADEQTYPRKFPKQNSTNSALSSSVTVQNKLCSNRTSKVSKRAAFGRNLGSLWIITGNF